jgi:hypothetical protein
MKVRHGNGRSQRTGSSRHDNVAILSNNCNNIVIAVLATGWGVQDCRTN